MIVSCEECNASFNLDENLLQPTGSKVRCSKCDHIFVAYPLAAEEDTIKPTEDISEVEVEQEELSLETGKEDDTEPDLPDAPDAEDIPEEAVADEAVEAMLYPSDGDEGVGRKPGDPGLGRGGQRAPSLRRDQTSSLGGVSRRPRAAGL